jgi:hypothetical protein
MNWHVLGLDIGQMADATALAALAAGGGNPSAPTYAAKHLRRWPLRTPYGKIIEDVRALCDRPLLPFEDAWRRRVQRGDVAVACPEDLDRLQWPRSPR